MTESQFFKAEIVSNEALATVEWQIEQGKKQIWCLVAS